MHRFIFVALLVLVTTAAVAQEPTVPHDPRGAFAETDEDGDGRIDRREFYQRMVEIFFHGDRDKDGYMTNAELSAVVVFPQDFAKADGDGDGRISLHEFMQVRFATFDEVDTSHDGLLSVEEVVDAFEARG